MGEFSRQGSSENNLMNLFPFEEEESNNVPLKNTMTELAKILPNLQYFAQVCFDSIGVLSSERVEKVMTTFKNLVVLDLDQALTKPDKIISLRKLFNEALNFFHMGLNLAKESFDYSEYKSTMTELLAMYLNLEIKEVESFVDSPEAVLKMQLRFNTCLHVLLDKSIPHMIDVFFKANLVKNESKKIYGPILGNLLDLKRISRERVSETLYVRYILAFKMCKTYLSEIRDPTVVNDLVAAELPFPNALLNSPRFSIIFPDVPTNTDNITLYLLKTRFNIKQSIQEFLKLVEGPVKSRVPPWMPVPLLNTKETKKVPNISNSTKTSASGKRNTTNNSEERDAHALGDCRRSTTNAFTASMTGLLEFFPAINQTHLNQTCSVSSTAVPSNADLVSVMRDVNGTTSSYFLIKGDNTTMIVNDTPVFQSKINQSKENNTVKDTSKVVVCEPHSNISQEANCNSTDSILSITNFNQKPRTDRLFQLEDQAQDDDSDETVVVKTEKEIECVEILDSDEDENKSDIIKNLGKRDFSVEILDSDEDENKSDIIKNLGERDFSVEILDSDEDENKSDIIKNLGERDFTHEILRISCVQNQIPFSGKSQPKELHYQDNDVDSKKKTEVSDASMSHEQHPNKDISNEFTKNFNSSNETRNVAAESDTAFNLPVTDHNKHNHSSSTSHKNVLDNSNPVISLAECPYLASNKVKNSSPNILETNLPGANSHIGIRLPKINQSKENITMIDISKVISQEATCISTDSSLSITNLKQKPSTQSPFQLENQTQDDDSDEIIAVETEKQIECVEILDSDEDENKSDIIKNLEESDFTHEMLQTSCAQNHIPATDITFSGQNQHKELRYQDNNVGNKKKTEVSVASMSHGQHPNKDISNEFTKYLISSKETRNVAGESYTTCNPPMTVHNEHNHSSLTSHKDVLDNRNPVISLAQCPYLANNMVKNSSPNIYEKNLPGANFPAARNGLTFNECHGPHLVTIHSECQASQSTESAPHQIHLGHHNHMLEHNAQIAQHNMYTKSKSDVDGFERHIEKSLALSLQLESSNSSQDSSFFIETSSQNKDSFLPLKKCHKDLPSPDITETESNTNMSNGDVSYLSSSVMNISEVPNSKKQPLTLECRNLPHCREYNVVRNDFEANSPAPHMNFPKKGPQKSFNINGAESFVSETFVSEISVNSDNAALEQCSNQFLKNGRIITQDDMRPFLSDTSNSHVGIRLPKINQSKENITTKDISKVTSQEATCNSTDSSLSITNLKQKPSTESPFQLENQTQDDKSDEIIAVETEKQIECVEILDSDEDENKSDIIKNLGESDFTHEMLHTSCAQNQIPATDITFSGQNQHKELHYQDNNVCNKKKTEVSVASMSHGQHPNKDISNEFTKYLISSKETRNVAGESYTTCNPPMTVHNEHNHSSLTSHKDVLDNRNPVISHAQCPYLANNMVKNSSPNIYEKNLPGANFPAARNGLTFSECHGPHPETIHSECQTSQSTESAPHQIHLGHHNHMLEHNDQIAQHNMYTKSKSDVDGFERHIEKSLALSLQLESSNSSQDSSFFIETSSQNKDSFLPLKKCHKDLPSTDITETESNTNMSNGEVSYLSSSVLNISEVPNSKKQPLTLECRNLPHCREYNVVRNDFEANNLAPHMNYPKKMPQKSFNINGADSFVSETFVSEISVNSDNAALEQCSNQFLQNERIITQDDMRPFLSDTSNSHVGIRLPKINQSKENITMKDISKVTSQEATCNSTDSSLSITNLKQKPSTESPFQLENQTQDDKSDEIIAVETEKQIECVEILDSDEDENKSDIKNLGESDFTHELLQTSCAQNQIPATDITFSGQNQHKELHYQDNNVDNKKKTEVSVASMSHGQHPNKDISNEFTKYLISSKETRNVAGESDTTCNPPMTVHNEHNHSSLTSHKDVLDNRNPVISHAQCPYLANNMVKNSSPNIYDRNLHGANFPAARHLVPFSECHGPVPVTIHSECQASQSIESSPHQIHLGHHNHMLERNDQIAQYNMYSKSKSYVDGFQRRIEKSLALCVQLESSNCSKNFVNETSAQSKDSFLPLKKRRKNLPSSDMTDTVSNTNINNEEVSYLSSSMMNMSEVANSKKQPLTLECRNLPHCYEFTVVSTDFETNNLAPHFNYIEKMQTDSYFQYANPNVESGINDQRPKFTSPNAIGVIIDSNIQDHLKTSSPGSKNISHLLSDIQRSSRKQFKAPSGLKVITLPNDSISATSVTLSGSSSRRSTIFSAARENVISLSRVPAASASSTITSSKANASSKANTSTIITKSISSVSVSGESAPSNTSQDNASVMSSSKKTSSLSFKRDTTNFKESTHSLSPSKTNTSESKSNSPVVSFSLKTHITSPDKTNVSTTSIGSMSAVSVSLQKVTTTEMSKWKKAKTCVKTYTRQKNKRKNESSVKQLNEVNKCIPLRGRRSRRKRS